MKKVYVVILTLILTISTIWFYLFNRENGKCNRTNVGWFWYNGPTCDEGCDLKYSSYKNVSKYNDHLLIHIIALRSADKEIYHFGEAIFQNDTLKLHIQERDKFHFGKEIKRSTCLTPTNFYFTGKIYPKTITLQLDSYRPFPLDSMPMNAR
jgi:hypothetical protein